MSLRRTDSRFLLPRPAASAVILGGLDPWRRGLSDFGVEVLETGHPRAPDLAVAPTGLARRAIASGAEMILLEGPVTRPLRTSRLPVQRLLARPGLEEPTLLLPLDDPGASCYAVDSWSVVDRRWKLARQFVAREMIRGRRFPNLPGRVTVVLRDDQAPFMVAAARAQLGLPEDIRSLLMLGQGDVLSRNVFHLFRADSETPTWVLKFARVPGYSEPFDRDERGLAIAARSGRRVAERAPRLLGRFVNHGIHASVETAVPGRRLRELLVRPGRRRTKMQLIDAVAGWILQVGEDTAASPQALAPERHRLSQEVVPRWRDLGASADLVSALPPLPAVVQHNDLGSWNIVFNSDEFSALDWESAQEHGLPLWDLFYFLADALAVLDGNTSGDERHVHTTRLFRGELPSSRILFKWVRRGITAAGVPGDSVGQIATLCWLHHSLSPVRRSVAIAAFAASSAQPVHGTERMAAAWLADPALGERWDCWRLG